MGEHVAAEGATVIFRRLLVGGMRFWSPGIKDCCGPVIDVGQIFARVRSAQRLLEEQVDRRSLVTVFEPVSDSGELVTNQLA